MKRTALYNTIAALLLLAPITIPSPAAAYQDNTVASACNGIAAAPLDAMTDELPAAINAFTVSATRDRRRTCTGADLRIKSNDTHKSRPDKSIHHDLEEFVDTLSGLELVAIVLAIVLPVSIFVPLLAIFLFGGRCEKCGRHRAMRTKCSEDTDSCYTTKNGRSIYIRNKTRVCKYCGHTDTLEHYGR